MVGSKSAWFGAAWLVSGACLALGCGVRQLPPAQAPPRRAPEVALPSQPPPEGHARLVLDTTEVRMRITARRQRSFGERSVPGFEAGPLCVTPCWADLPVGTYELFFSSADPAVDRGDRGEVRIVRGLNYYLRAPGRYDAPDGGSQVGAALLYALAGALLGGAAGLAVAFGDPAAAIAASVGSGAAGIGVFIGATWFALEGGRAVAQEGSATYWVEPARP